MFKAFCAVGGVNVLESYNKQITRGDNKERVTLLLQNLQKHSEGTILRDTFKKEIMKKKKDNILINRLSQLFRSFQAAMISNIEISSKFPFWMIMLPPPGDFKLVPIAKAITNRNESVVQKLLSFSKY
jgi:hypothetical protein